MTMNVTNSTQPIREISLEELDVLCRKYNHLHDEEVLHIIARFFARILGIFKHKNNISIHS